MAAALNSNWWQVVTYCLVGALAVGAAIWERHLLRTGDRRDLWPFFWAMTAVVLLTMAIGHAGDFGDLIADYGRRSAYSDGWYETRRTAQTVAVGVVSAVWAVVTAVAVWRFPERRRRYLPMAVITFGLMCFAAIRVISLHQVDSLLYRRHIAGVRIGVLVELSGLVIAGAAILFRAVTRRQVAEPSEHARPGVPAGLS
jgi:hypothetical protein